MKVLAVGTGGFLGAILRYTVGKAIPSESMFPLGTLIINLSGCLFLAWFFTITAKRKNINVNIVLAVGTGFTGAFTTFSTFLVETLNLIKNHQFFFAVLYVLINILGGLGLAILGSKLAGFKMQPEKRWEGGSK